MKKASERQHGDIEGLREMMDIKMEIFSRQVRQLSDLCKEGLLTEEEFAAKKANLLARL